MTATTEQVLQHLEALTKMNDALTATVKETQEKLQESHNMVQQNVIDITACRNQISILAKASADLNTRLSTMAHTHPLSPIGPEISFHASPKQTF